MIGRQVFTEDVEAGWLESILMEHGIKADGRELLSAANRHTESFWPLLGARSVHSMDASAYEGADLIHDLNTPVPVRFRGQYSVVVDGGCIEHIFNAVQAVKNCMEMVKVGGHYLCVTVANSLLGHGFYQFSPEWAFRVFAPQNGFVARCVLLVEVGIRAPRFYKVIDPIVVHRRVELAWGIPSYLMVLAQREAEMPIFATTPQQSDYATQWSSCTLSGRGQNPDEPVVPTQLSPERSSVASSSTPKRRIWIPSFLRWDSPIRRMLRGIVRRSKNMGRHRIRSMRIRWRRWRRGSVVPNELGLNASYFVPVTYEQMRQGLLDSIDKR